MPDAHMTVGATAFSVLLGKVIDIQTEQTTQSEQSRVSTLPGLLLNRYSTNYITIHIHQLN
jgi:hypothetical protein